MIIYDPIRPGDVRSVDALNDIYTAVDAATAAVDGDAFTEEGIDVRVLDANPVASREATISETTRLGGAGLAAAAVWTQYVHGATTFRTGAIAELAANEWLRIRSRVFCASHFSAGLGLSVGTTLQMRHVVDDSGGTAEVPASQRGMRRWGTLGIGYHGVLFIESWLKWDDVSGAINWVEVQYQLAGGPPVCHPGRSLLWVDRFKRAAVL